MGEEFTEKRRWGAQKTTKLGVPETYWREITNSTHKGPSKLLKRIHEWRWQGA
jgi:hypothetical protein